MSDLETDPRETDATPQIRSGPEFTVLDPRVVPLGGLRGISVARTLPNRELPTVGAWCFLDHFGPDADPMSVLPHPHTGLQTVTWLFTGEVRHRDGIGSDVVIRQGELDVMTSGACRLGGGRPTFRRGRRARRRAHTGAANRAHQAAPAPAPPRKGRSDHGTAAHHRVITAAVISSLSASM